jgi:hypothetical protein
MIHRPALLMLTLLLCIAAQARPWHAGAHNSPGWRYMTPHERVEHQRRLRSFTTVADCKAYLQQHHAQMAERARRAGHTLTARQPDSCDELQRRGQLR